MVNVKRMLGESRILVWKSVLGVYNVEKGKGKGRGVQIFSLG